MQVGIITCPECGSRSEEPMPENACLRFFACPACHVLLKPATGDCCVFCSYGDAPCPPIQRCGADPSDSPLP